MKVPMKSAIQDMYSEIKLTEEELEQFQRQCPATIQATTPPQPPKFQWLGLGSFAAAICTVILTLAIGYFSSTPTLRQFNSQSDVIDAIVADVIDNHLAYKTLNYNTNSLPELREHFSYLGFILATSKLITQANVGELVGARPCFILTIPAAQLRYQVDDNVWTTVLQARYTENIYGKIPDISLKQQPLHLVTRGVEVSLWQEEGLLFAVAK